MEADGRARQLHPAVRHRRQMGLPTWSKCRAPARSTPKSTSTRKSISSSKAAASPRCGSTATPSATCSNGRRARCSRFPSMPCTASSMPARAPALLLGGTTAPNLMNLINNLGAIFDCPYQFRDRFQRRRRFLQIQGRHRARSGARARHAAHQFHSRHRQLRSAARQPPLARLPPRRAVHDRQYFLSVDRPARERPLLQGPCPHLGRRAGLPQGQGLHLHVAGACSASTPWQDGKAAPGQAGGLRAGRHGLGGAGRRALVSTSISACRRSRCGSPPGSARTIRAASPARPARSTPTTPAWTFRKAAPRSPTGWRTPSSPANTPKRCAAKAPTNRMDPAFYDKGYRGELPKE